MPEDPMQVINEHTYGQLYSYAQEGQAEIQTPTQQD